MTPKIRSVPRRRALATRDGAPSIPACLPPQVLGRVQAGRGVRGVGGVTAYPAAVAMTHQAKAAAEDCVFVWCVKKCWGVKEGYSQLK